MFFKEIENKSLKSKKFFSSKAKQLPRDVDLFLLMHLAPHLNIYPN